MVGFQDIKAVKHKKNIPMNIFKYIYIYIYTQDHASHMYIYICHRPIEPMNSDKMISITVSKNVA